MAVQQSTPRKLTAHSCNVGRNLIADRPVTPHVLATTLEEHRLTTPAQHCRAEQPLVCGQVVLLPGDVFWLVESRNFPGRCYVLTEKEGAWQCSNGRDAKCTRWCIRTIEKVREQKRAAREQQAAAA